MGQVLEVAQQRPDYDTTLVLFLSDHGEMNMEHRQVWKNSHYEPSLRVPLIVSGGAVAGRNLPRGRVVSNITSLLDVFPTLLDWAQLPQPAAGQLSGSSLAPFLGATRRRGAGAEDDARRSYAVSQYHSNMGNTGAFCIVEAGLKLVVFGHAFNETFGAYAPQLFDLVADPSEATNLAPSRPDDVRRLEALLRAELASGFNALSPSGDYEAIDAYVKRQQQQLYRRFFLDPTRVDAQFERLRRCEATLSRAASQGAGALAWALAREPDLEEVCGANREPLSADDAATPATKLRKLFKKAYTGFDNADWQKVQQWNAEDPAGLRPLRLMKRPADPS